METLSMFASGKVMTQILIERDDLPACPIVHISLPVRFFPEEGIIVANENPKPKEQDKEEEDLAAGLLELVLSIYEQVCHCPLILSEEERDEVADTLSRLFLRADMKLDRMDEAAKRDETKFPPLPSSEREWRFADTRVDELQKEKDRLKLAAFEGESEEEKKKRQMEALKEVESLDIAPMTDEQVDGLFSVSLKKKSGNKAESTWPSNQPGGLVIGGGTRDKNVDEMGQSPFEGRRPCRHGETCLHQSLPAHSDHFSHPGDADYFEPMLLKERDDNSNNNEEREAVQGTGSGSRLDPDHDHGQGQGQGVPPPPGHIQPMERKVKEDEKGQVCDISDDTPLTPLSIMQRMETTTAIQDIDLSCVDFPDLMGSFSMDLSTVRDAANKEFLDQVNLRTGLAGEDLVYRYLREKHSKDIEKGEVTVTWENASGESGRPYDIVVSRDMKPFLFIEVKTTSSVVPSSKPIEISWQEVKFALEKGASYHVYRVVLRSEDQPECAVLPHVSDLFASKKLQLLFHQVSS